MALWLRPYLDDDGLQRIEAAVRSAEKRTRGEIVPVLARRSAPYGHTPWMLGGLVFLALLLSEGRAWDGIVPWGFQGVLLLDLAAAAVCGLLFGRLAPLQRAFTPAKDQAQAVSLAAEAAFYRYGLRRTKESTGILLYVSLAEHRAVVLADHGIASKVPPETWDEVCALLLKGAASRDLASGFEDAVAACARILAKPFPARKKNPDELENRLRVLG
jgi:putative membrane protein